MPHDIGPRQLTPDLLLHAYRSGVFPMADSADDPHVYWVEPRWRGVLPLDGLHLSRSLKKTLKQEPYTITLNNDFSGVLDGCADRDTTWINREIRLAYQDLHALGHAHSMEVWAGGTLVGGLYGVAIGGAFFGESMFSRRRDASKIALVYLVSRLRAGGFRLLDTQFVTPHLQSLGAVEVPRDTYRQMLSAAVAVGDAANLYRQPLRVSAQEICNE